MKILVLNCGSSSLKYQLINMDNEEVMAKGVYERIGQPNSVITHKVNGEKYIIEKSAPTHNEAVSVMIEQLTNNDYGVVKSLDDINAIGHRIVHGGEKFNKSVIITNEVIETIRECADLAPVHNPAALMGIEACQKLMSNKKMVAVFDTAFHQTIEKDTYLYPIPYKYYENYKIRKYGFHGTSHSYVSKRVAEIANKPLEELRTIVCHLGQGASLCAVKGGKSVDTSMGLTPLGGILMCARSGDLDPSIVTYLMKKENTTPDEMDKILNKESGIYGISGVSPDVRDIEKAASEGNVNAKLALEAYDLNIAQFIAKYIVSMGGVDNIVFTAGVGENQGTRRLGICKKLEFLGIKINEEKNMVKGEEMEISENDSKIRVWVIPTNEELVIARDTMNLIND
ncbi:MAG: acetate kinase [Clostridiales bacterium]|nr:acetate kinase [Clostridiales bacterium]